MKTRYRLATSISAIATAVALSIATPAHAQLTTATVRGQVSNSAAVAPGATITAVSVDTGATARAVAGADGSYVLTGLSPGSYDVTFAVGRPNGHPPGHHLGRPDRQPRHGCRGAGQGHGGSDGPGRHGAGGAIIVTGRRLVETRTSEIATNVTPTRSRTCRKATATSSISPQLAPGIRLVTAGRASARLSAAAASA